MSPREVAGLQALAMAHGGKLSINPDTGLPEAGFLENVLPVVAAGALTYMTAGAAAPILAESLAISTAAGGLLAGAGIGALVGGGMSALQGGDFGRGALMGGLTGAASGYGAAGGFEGLFGSTAPTIDPVTGKAVEGSAILTPTGTEAVTPPPTPTPTPSAPAPVATAPGGTFAPPVQTFAQQQAALAAQQAQMAQAGALQSGLDLGGVGASPAAMAPGSTVPLAVSGAAPAAAAAGKTIFGMGPGQAALGLGALGLFGSMSDRRKYGVPTVKEEESPLARISPDFRGYEPPRPNPYYRAQYPVYGASGGVIALAAGGMPSGPVERMSSMGQQPGMYPQGMIDKTYYATPTQRPASMEVVKSDYDTPVNPITGIGSQFAKGGISDLGGYSDGGRLLKGPGDGVSDDIPAQIGQRQPARLADGEFVVPARIVSEIGNGSTDAGARKLYAMMDRVQKARRKSMGKGRHAVDSKAEKLLPV
jgi:hypothetical protein